MNVVQELELELVFGQRTRVFALAGRTLEGQLLQHPGLPP